MLKRGQSNSLCGILNKKNLVGRKHLHFPFYTESLRFFLFKLTIKIKKKVKGQLTRQNMFFN